MSTGSLYVMTGPPDIAAPCNEQDTSQSPSYQGCGMGHLVRDQMHLYCSQATSPAHLTERETLQVNRAGIHIISNDHAVGGARSSPMQSVSEAPFQSFNSRHSSTGTCSAAEHLQLHVCYGVSATAGVLPVHALHGEVGDLRPWLR